MNLLGFRGSKAGTLWAGARGRRAAVIEVNDSSRVHRHEECDCEDYGEILERIEVAVELEPFYGDGQGGWRRKTSKGHELCPSAVLALEDSCDLADIVFDQISIHYFAIYQTSD